LWVAREGVLGVGVLMRRYFPVGLKTEASAGMYCLQKIPGEWTRKCDTAEAALTSDEINP
jgi:hypothetical protein